MLRKLAKLLSIVLLSKMKYMKLFDLNQAVRFYLIIVAVNY